jgi:hypothetical protein
MALTDIYVFVLIIKKKYRCLLLLYAIVTEKKVLSHRVRGREREIYVYIYI